MPLVVVHNPRPRCHLPPPLLLLPPLSSHRSPLSSPSTAKRSPLPYTVRSAQLASRTPHSRECHSSWNPLPSALLRRNLPQLSTQPSHARHASCVFVINTTTTRVFSSAMPKPKPVQKER
jgi:hypothetical protein